MGGREVSTNEQLLMAWDELSKAVACLVDSSKSGASGAKALTEPPGIKQLVERKSGLFRSNMMGYPYISLHLPISPHISLHLPGRASSAPI